MADQAVAKVNKPKARALTREQIKKALPNATEQDIQRVMAEQTAPAVKRKKFVVEAMLTNEEARTISQKIGYRLVPRFKGGKKNAAPAKKPNGKG